MKSISRMDKLFTVAALVFVWMVLDAGTANAGYLDPGSGSTLVQVIIGTIAATKRLWGRFTGLFTGKRGA